MKAFYSKNIFGKKRTSLGEQIGNLFLIFCIYLVLMMYMFSAIYVPVEVDGSSMENSYFNQDIVYYLPNASYDYGDVVIVKVSESRQLLKRVVAKEGDRINFVITHGDNGKIYSLTLNGKVLIETYIKSQNDMQQTYYNIYGGNNDSLIYNHPESFSPSTMTGAKQPDLVVGEGEIFVLGDNRKVSLDSSTYGAFKTEQIIGRVDFDCPTGKAPLWELIKQFFWPF